MTRTMQRQFSALTEVQERILLALHKRDYEMVTELIAFLHLGGNTFYYHKRGLIEMELIMEERIRKGRARETRIALTDRGKRVSELLEEMSSYLHKVSQIGLGITEVPVNV